MSSSYREELDRWLNNLEVQANTVFDVGGSQEKVSERVKKFDVKEYLIFDLAQPHVDSPKPDVVCDLNSGQNDAINGYLGLADVVFCLEVFDYIYRPEIALKTLKSLLKKDGTLWVTFPMMYPLHQPVEDDALRYMPAGIKKLANVVGLEIVEMIPRKTETDAIYNAFRVERMRCAKHQDHDISGWIVRFTK